jgi:hypothetical protein
MISDRKSEAKKKLFILEAEAKRTAARLETTRANFDQTVEELAAPILKSLTKTRDDNAKQLSNELAPKLRKDAGQAEAAMQSFIRCCNGVGDFDAAISSVEHNLQAARITGRRTGLIQALQAAENLL